MSTTVTWARVRRRGIPRWWWPGPHRRARLVGGVDAREAGKIVGERESQKENERRLLRDFDVRNFDDKGIFKMFLFFLPTFIGSLLAS